MLSADKTVANQAVGHAAAGVPEKDSIIDTYTKQQQESQNMKQAANSPLRAKQSEGRNAGQTDGRYGAPSAAAVTRQEQKIHAEIGNQHDPTHIPAVICQQG